MKSNVNRAGGTVINWIGVFAQIVIAIFFVPFFLNTVGDKSYGLYSFSSSIVLWFDTLMVAVATGYYKFLTREKAKAGEYGEARACGIFFKIFITIAIGVLVVGALFDLLMFKGIIPLNEYNTTEKNQICLIILISLLSSSITSALTTYKCYHFYKETYILIYSFNLAQLILQTVISVVLLKSGFGVVSVCIATVSSSLFFTILLSIIAKYKLKEKVSVRSKSTEDKAYRKELLKEIIVFSVFIIINTVVDTLNKSLDKTILGFYNADQVANYQLAFSFPQYLISFTSIISIVYTQKITDVYYNEGGVKPMDELFIKVSKIQTCLCMLLVGGFIACGKEFIFMWLDDTRFQVYVIGCIFMVLYSLTCSNTLVITARRILNCHMKAAFIYVGIMLFNIALSVALVNLLPRDQAIWACVSGTAVTYILGQWVIMQIYDSKNTKLSIKKFFGNYLKYLVIIAILDLFVIRLGDILNIQSNIANFLIKGGLFAVLYFAIVTIIEKETVSGAISLIKSKFKKN